MSWEVYSDHMIVLTEIREEGERRGGAFIWTRQLEVIEPLERMEGEGHNAHGTT